MMKNKRLEDYSKEIKQCVKCGVCQAHCPAYRHNRKEGDVARGKIALASSLLDGSVDLEERLQQDVSMCLMCGSCVSKCPNKVPTHEIVGAMRREVTQNQGLSITGKAVNTFLQSTGVMKAAAKVGALLSPAVFKKIPQKSGLNLRFAPEEMGERTVPKLKYRNLFNRVPEYLEAKGDKPVVGFFAGCSITYIYPEIGLSLISLLQQMGYGVHTPRAQMCCGIPALSSGAGELVEKLAEANITAFGKYDEQQIITACASCNGGIGEYYSSMEGADRDFSNRVIDFTTFCVENGVVDELSAMQRWDRRDKVTYHDPCHLKVQNITREPREILKALPNVEFIEMEDSSLCCGLGGTFSVHHYSCSKSIGARKIPGLKESGATRIATACPGCILQLQDSINHAGMDVEAVHILDLMHQAYTKNKGTS